MREFRLANQSLVLLAHRDLKSFWSSVDVSADVLDIKSDLLDYYPALITAYGDAAALLGADWYDMLRDAPPSAASFRATLSKPPNVNQIHASARWALGPMFQAERNPGQVLENLLGSSQRLVLQAGRETVVGSARRDSVRIGYARVPAGPTCDFCEMVADRGFVYGSEDAAGESEQWHDGCDCVVVPGND